MWRHKLNPNSLGTPDFNKVSTKPASKDTKPVKVAKKRASRKKVSIVVKPPITPTPIGVDEININKIFHSIEELTAFFKPYFVEDDTHKFKYISFDWDEYDGTYIKVMGYEKDITDLIKTKEVGDTFEYNGTKYMIGADGLNVLFINSSTFMVEELGRLQKKHFNISSK